MGARRLAGCRQRPMAVDERVLDGASAGRGSVPAAAAGAGRVGPAAAARARTTFTLPAAGSIARRTTSGGPGSGTSTGPAGSTSRPTTRWTPYGYVFVDGYWDYPLRQRGVLFAPVYFSGRRLRSARVRLLGRATSSTTMSCTGRLFVRPGGGYYFGDYFEARYTAAWLSQLGQRVGRRRRARPVPVPLRPAVRLLPPANGPNWAVQVNNVYVERAQFPDRRPPRTLVQQNVVVNNITNNTTIVNNNTTDVNNVKNVTMVAPVTNVDKSVVNLTKMTPAQQQRPAQWRRKLGKSSAQRAKAEAQMAPATAAGPVAAGAADGEARPAEDAGRGRRPRRRRPRPRRRCRPRRPPPATTPAARTGRRTDAAGDRPDDAGSPPRSPPAQPPRRPTADAADTRPPAATNHRRRRLGEPPQPPANPTPQPPAAQPPAQPPMPPPGRRRRRRRCRRESARRRRRSNRRRRQPAAATGPAAAEPSEKPTRTSRPAGPPPLSRSVDREPDRQPDAAARCSSGRTTKTRRLAARLRSLLVNQPLRHPVVGVDPPVAEERPVAAHVSSIRCRSHSTISSSSRSWSPACQHAAERIADERRRPRTPARRRPAPRGRRG